MPQSLFNIFNKGDTLFSIILSSLTIKTCSTFFHPYFYSFFYFLFKVITYIQPLITLYL